MDRKKIIEYFYLSASIILVLIAIVVFSGHVFRFWPYTLDDSFISFRYAKNVVSGYGITFNPYREPIEGYTAFLWVILMTIPHFLRLDAVMFSKWCGVGSILLCMIIVFRFVSKLSADSLTGFRKYLPASIAVFMLACFQATAVHAVSGMETAFCTFLMTLFLYLLTMYCDSPNKRKSAMWMVLSGLVLGLTRPETNLVVLIGLALVYVSSPKEKKSLLRKTIFFSYILPGGIYFLWRLLYYRHLFPLPFYVKAITAQPLAGQQIVGAFLTSVGILTWPFIFFAIAQYGRKLQHAGTGITVFIVFYLFPEHIMGGDWRFLFPSVPFIFITAASGITSFHLMLENFSWTGIKKVLMLCCFYLAILYFYFSYFELNLNNNTTVKREYAHGLNKAHIALGKKLAEFPGKKESLLLAVSDAGATPYYSGWQTLDYFGLNNNYLALHDRTRINPFYVISQYPDVIVFISATSEAFIPLIQGDDQILAACRRTGMVKLKTLTFIRNVYYLWVMAYPDTPVAQYLSNWNYQ